MGLESSATIISQLNPLNPTDSDPTHQGDNHLRLIKQTLQNTFKNIKGVITATHEEINKLTGFKGAAADLNKLVGWTGALDDLKKLTDLTASAEELNKLDGYTGTTSALNRAATLVGVPTAKDEVVYATGASTFAKTAFTALGRKLVGLETEAAMRTALSLGSFATIEERTRIRTAAEWAEGTSGIESLINPIKLVALIRSLALGEGQKWTDVTNSRNRGKAYQNDTGRSIEVFINLSWNWEYDLWLSHDGKTWVGTGPINQDRDDWDDNVSFTIPAGHYYRLDHEMNSNDRARRWLELR